jgi:PAS domain S-box-containing protein
MASANEVMPRDPAPRREVDEALRQSEERLRLLVQCVKDYAIFMLDTDGHIVSWNEGAQRFKGWSADEIIGRHFSTFYPPEDLAADKPGMELRVAAAEGRFEDEGWWVRKDGTLFWANVVITAMRDSSGELVGFAKVTRDLTERRRAEQQAIADARRVAEIEAANRTKSEFLAALSHELRTPLNAIAGYTELLQLGVRGPVNEQQYQDLERIRQSQKHLLLIVNDLLSFARIDGGHLEYRFERVHLCEVLRGIESMTLPQASAKQLDFRFADCPDDATAWADFAKVQQILLNLVSNAVKFTPDRGSVRVTCTRRDAWLDVSVSDSGPGIPPEHQQGIFEPFVQLGRTLTSAHEGVGLGLAISRDLARGMAGDLTVRSEPGEGATFSLSLPLAPSD